MLCAWQLPAAPNLAAPFIMAINVSFSKHRRFREQMLHYMAKNVCAALFNADTVIFLYITCFATHSMWACHAHPYPQ